jgi:hypothetical protein
MATEHKVKQGEDIYTIAADFGIHPDTIWNHSANRELKELRKHPGILNPGDRVVIPDKQPREETGATGECHVFRKKTGTVKLKMRLLGPDHEAMLSKQEAAPPDDDEDSEDVPLQAHYEDEKIEDTPPEVVPLKNKRCIVNVAGKLIETTTNGDGVLECSVPAHAKTVTITADPGTPGEAHFFADIGALDPVTTSSGLKQRLSGLGFLDPSMGHDDHAVEMAMKRFNHHHGIKTSDAAGGEAQKNVVDKFGS